MQHIGAAAQLGKDQPLGLQFCIGIFNRDTVYAQTLGKLTAGGQTSISCQAAGKNPLPQVCFDLLVKRNSTLTIEWYTHFVPRGVIGMVNISFFCLSM